MPHPRHHTAPLQTLALQQLNCDLTLQLELYQRMVARLKDWMEHVGGAASCAYMYAAG